MAFSEHRFSFGGKKVKDYGGGELTGLDVFGYRVRQDYDSAKKFDALLDELLSQPNVGELTHLLIGAYSDEMYDQGPEKIIERLIAHKGKLSGLRAVFMGDITYEENEISWIHMCDMSPLLGAFPELEHFAVRGSQGLAFTDLKAPRLKSLTVQSGGLDVGVVRQILSADLPALETLDLYLGTENYGANTRVEDLAPLLRGEVFPGLLHLGLRNWDHADELAGVLANAPILQRIKTLDLSLGVLTDTGVRALMTSPYLGGLEKLDIHHHFVTPETLAELKAHLRQLKVKIDASDAQQADDDGDGRVWRFVAHGE